MFSKTANSKQQKGKFRKGVFMVVYRRASEDKNHGYKFLIQKRKLHWNGFEFPKGGLKKGERRIDGVRREIFEETGLEILELKNHKRSGKYLYNKVLKDRPGVIGQTWNLFSAEVGKGKVKLDKREHFGFEWLSYKKARDKLTWETQKECLDVVWNWLQK